MAEGDPGVFVRVNGANLAQHQNQRVALVGEVISSGHQTVLKAADGVEVKVQVLPGSNCGASKFVEVVGIAEGANFVREEKSTDFGNEFDLDVYNRAITLAQGPMAKLFQQAATA